ncbi:PREDICTED: F-box [Prunus dulcis]|uniref:PREDICTED: F-box n=1 Tax=Prunus dulcis TaxID=3755 RepID=A0A5E4G7S3_PRUDU|nr:PREDICTED: F-box [Prunus dulcis]
MAKLRPPMSRAVKILSGEVDIKDSQISEPGLISDIMEIKMGQQQSCDQSTFSKASTASSMQNRGSGASLMAKGLNGSGGSQKEKDLRAGVALCTRATSLSHVDALRELGHCLQDGY